MSMKKLLALLLAVVMVLGLVACGPEQPTEPTTPTTPSTPTPSNPDDTDPTEDPDKIVVEVFPEGDYIWKTSTSVLTTSWNPHSYQTNDQSLPLDYTTSGLYTFIFNDELHPVEGKREYEGYVIVPEMAAEMPVDVTETFKAAHPEFNIPADATAGYAYVIKLNPDACFDDGTPINAETYVQSMERLLRPELLHYRAADWYGTADLSIAGAEKYNNQGMTTWYAANDLHAVYSTELDSELVFTMGPDLDANCYIRDSIGFPDSYTLEMTIAYLNANYGFAPTAEEIAKIEGKTLAEIKADAELNAIWESALGWWQTEPNEELHFFIAAKTYEDNYPFEKVGVIATGEYELTIVLDKSLSGFYLLYNLSGLSNNLVKIDLYDSLLVSEESATGELVWSSTYNTSVDTTVSFGPYKMSEYQMDKYMHFVRNENWWGYSDGKHIYKDPTDGLYYPMYQTSEVDIQVVSEASTTKLMFMKGQLMGYGLQADDYATLRQSEYCFATPGTTIFFLILNGHMESIKSREAAEDFDQTIHDLEMLTNTKFHMAMGLSYDKDHFASTISPSRSGALGIIGTGYIYDPDTGAQYRDSEQAKQVLCDFYGVDTTKFADLDAAVDSITGYDPEQAKVLFAEAFKEGIEAGYITDNDNDGKSDQIVYIEYAMSSGVNDFMTKTINYLNEKAAEVATGTPFEGKIEFYMSAPYGDDWSNKIREGLSDTVLGGWNGSTMNPFGLTDLYTNPSRQYDAAWYDATKIELTINVPVNGENKDVTLTLKQWSDALNGSAVEVDGVTYNFGSGQADVEVRLDILAACEGKILESYNYLPMLQDGSMALLSQQVFYVRDEYNPVMGRGGLAYTKYNMNEADWAAYVAAQGGELKY